MQAIKPLIAFSKLAESNIMNGALPPNSICTRFTVEAEFAKRILPTGVDPVKEIFFTKSCSHKCLPIVGVFERDVVMTFRQPGGNPAFSAIFCKIMR